MLFINNFSAFNFDSLIKKWANRKIDIKVGKIETEKRFEPKVGYIDFAGDIFAESEDNRIIIEILRVKHDYNFDHFLHYHTMAITELQKSANDYKIHSTVYTIVVLTSSTAMVDKQGQEIKDDILISDMNPRNLEGKLVNCYEHKLIFLNPNFKTAKTPLALIDWFDLILESIANPDSPKINLDKGAIKKAVELIETDNLTPEERTSAKIAAATEETRKWVERLAKSEGQKEGEMKANLENARKMLAEGFQVEMISKITGLDAETINQLHPMASDE